MPDVGALVAGGYVITWDSITAGVSGWDIDSQRARFGGERLVNTSTFGSQQRGVVAGLADGGYVVAWTSLLAEDDLRGIYMQRFAADDTPLTHLDLLLELGSFLVRALHRLLHALVHVARIPARLHGTIARLLELHDDLAQPALVALLLLRTASLLRLTCLLMHRVDRLAQLVRHRP